MSFYIPIPSDLSTVKPKLLFGLTKRQLVCFSIGAAIGLPVFFGLRKLTGNNSFACMVMMAVMLPMFFLGMYQKNGEPLEIILKHRIQAKYIRPKVRVYRSDSVYDALLRAEELEKEVNEIVSKYPQQEKCEQRGSLQNPVLSKS